MDPAPPAAQLNRYAAALLPLAAQPDRFREALQRLLHAEVSALRVPLADPEKVLGGPLRTNSDLFGI